MQKNMKRVISIYFMISICLCFSACGTVNEEHIKTPYESDETNSYNILNQETVENDWTKYGKMKTVHEEFPNEDGSVTFYYDPRFLEPVAIRRMQ